MRAAMVIAALAVAHAAAGPPVPAPHSPLPRSPARLAARLAADAGAARTAVGAWRAGHPGRRARPPRRVVLLVLDEQRILRRLARHPATLRTVLGRLHGRTRAEADAGATALHDLFVITGPPNEARFRTGPPAPPAVLLGYYRAAQKRFHVRWPVLAAVNLVESNFGRLRNASSAGAVGPMQFIPATWAQYGLGGNIRDPHDAILGAANLLHAAGTPRRERAALLAYNHSPLYVSAVERFADRMARDPRAFWVYWSWQSFRRTGHGDAQLTGPGS